MTPLELIAAGAGLGTVVTFAVLVIGMVIMLAVSAPGAQEERDGEAGE